MRNIKFRVWSKIGKRIYDWEEMQIPHHGLGNYFKWSDMYELMQYTGLRDKNGKEYCQDDFFRDNRTGYIYRVIRANGAFWGEPTGEPFEGYELTLLCHINVTSEIIGNRFENPELLEANKVIATE